MKVLNVDNIQIQKGTCRIYVILIKAILVFVTYQTFQNKKK